MLQSLHFDFGCHFCKGSVCFAAKMPAATGLAETK